ncbi:MAG: DUF423 domain-containing protein [Pseudomonadales bacterium]
MSPTGGRALLALASLFGATGVALGALGAHALRGALGADAGAVWQTATLYHLLHAVALLVVALTALRAGTAGLRTSALHLAGWAFAAGIVLFCGSLYLLALDGPRWLGPVTPVGGVAFIAGWLALLLAGVRGDGLR